MKALAARPAVVVRKWRREWGRVLMGWCVLMKKAGKVGEGRMREAETGEERGCCRGLQLAFGS